MGGKNIRDRSQGRGRFHDPCVWKNTRSISVKDMLAELGNRGFLISNVYGQLKGKTFRLALKADVQELLDNINDILKL